MVFEHNADVRSRELEENAQIAYRQVPTQEQMLNGGKPLPAEFGPRQPDNHADPITLEIEAMLHEAAQQGNIGGG